MPEYEPPPDIPADGLKHDWELLDRYQSFSAELLRISLLGIAGVGFLVTLFTGTDTTLKVDVTGPGTVRHLLMTLVGLGVSAGSALGHRYVSSDSMAFHISLLRMRLRGASPDEIGAEKRSRDRRFKWSAWLLLLSALALGIGTASLALAFGGLLAGAAWPSTATGTPLLPLTVALPIWPKSSLPQ